MQFAPCPGPSKLERKEKKKAKKRKEKKERKKKPGLICIFYHVDIFILYPHIKFAEIS